MDWGKPRKSPSEHSVFGPISEPGTFCLQCSVSDYPTTAPCSKSY